MDCPKSIQNLAGTLDLTMCCIREITDAVEHWDEAKILDLAVELSTLWSVEKLNHLGDDFKQIYNRILDSNLRQSRPGDTPEW